MDSAAQNQISLFWLLGVAVVAAALLIVPIEYAPVVLAAASGAALFAAWCAAGRFLPAIGLWFVLVICFDEEFWRTAVPFFFNVTFARIFILVLGALWMGMWAMGRFPLRRARSVLPLMAAILAYFTVSAAISGFTTVAVASVHYRLIGGFWFAFAMFFFVLHAVSGERDLRDILIFLFVTSLYLTFTGWCEHFKVWSLVFPQYIADPGIGIHFGRVRGPFLVSATMGVALSFCFFGNLLLARRLTLPLRLGVWAVSLLMLPPIFWTQTRSVWVGFLLAGMIWVGFNQRSRSKPATVALLTALAILVLAANLQNFRTSERSRGGVADVEPVYVRLGLAMITWDMFLDRPIFGVGYGHFRDVAPRYARDVASPYYQFASPAMEHNNFLSILADTGLLGLGLYVALLLALLRLSVGLYQRLPAGVQGLMGRDIVVLYWTLMVVFLVDAMFRETSVHPFTNSLFFGISGMMAAVDWLLRPQPIPAPPPWAARRPPTVPSNQLPTRSGSGGPWAGSLVEPSVASLAEPPVVSPAEPLHDSDT